jgi:hypothetical protein
MFCHDPVLSEGNTVNNLVRGGAIRLANQVISGGNIRNKPNVRRRKYD